MRVNIGEAFGRWQELWECKGLNNVAEVVPIFMTDKCEIKLTKQK